MSTQAERERRRHEAKEAEHAVHDLVREREGKPPAKRVKLSKATADDHLAAMQGGDVLIIPDDEEN